jgi:hypothetical protein
MDGHRIIQFVECSGSQSNHTAHGGDIMGSSAKKVRVSALAASTWVTLPGNTADFQADSDMLDDTVFGHPFKSMQPDILSWSVSSNAIYKGYAGYQAIIKKTGVVTVMTDEPAALLVGQRYRITDATKRLLHVSTTVLVKDNGVNHTVDVDNIDFLFGIVTFKVGYVVTGPVLVTGAYLPASQICAMNKYSLSQQAEAVDETDLCVAQSNSGFRQYKPGLKNVSLELSGFYRPATSFLQALKDRERLMIEINPDGAGESVARGFFIAKSDKQSGKVGALEEESVSFDLYVPDNALLHEPFGWQHKTTSKLNGGIKTLIESWETGDLVDVRYLEDGTTGKQGSAVLTNISLAGGLGALNEFSVQFKGSGGITNI